MSFFSSTYALMVIYYIFLGVIYLTCASWKRPEFDVRMASIFSLSSVFKLLTMLDAHQNLFIQSVDKGSRGRIEAASPMRSPRERVMMVSAMQMVSEVSRGITLVRADKLNHCQSGVARSLSTLGENFELKLLPLRECSSGGLQYNQFFFIRAEVVSFNPLWGGG